MSVVPVRRRAQVSLNPVTGAYQWTRREDEVETYRLDLTDLLVNLPAGTTIVSVALKAGDTSGVTVTSTTLVVNEARVVISHGVGTATLVVTMSEASQFEIPLTWLPPEGNLDSDAWTA